MKNITLLLPCVQMNTVRGCMRVGFCVELAVCGVFGLLHYSSANVSYYIKAAVIVQTRLVGWYLKYVWWANQSSMVP